MLKKVKIKSFLVKIKNILSFAKESIGFMAPKT